MVERNKKWLVAGLVFLGHVLLLLLVDELLQEEPRDAADTKRSTLFFIRPLLHPPLVSTEIPAGRSATAELKPPKVAAPSMPAIAGPALPSEREPAIDWQREASQAASNAIQSKQAADALKFSEGSKAPRRKCVRPKAPEWRREGPTYGFSGGLPFMRFHDDRCIFVLLFVGCAFGAKPKADSHLFDNMRNYPNDSSVPDLDECDDSP